MDFIQKAEAWKQTRRGRVTFVLVEGLLAYVFASWAIDSGSWLHYLLAIIFMVGTVQNVVRLIKDYGKK